MITPIDVIRQSMLRVKCLKLRKYLEGARRAQAVQRRNLLERVARNASSRFGRDHGFGEIRSVADFRRRVPVSNYEYHRPYIADVMQGQTEALFAPGTRVIMYAQTSGTTAEPKHIPVTERFYRQYKKGWQTWGTGAYRDHPAMLRKLTLQFTSDWQTSRAPDGTPCGNISGMAAETRPFYIASLFVLPALVNRISHPAAKHYTALRLGLARPNVGMVITANPSTLVEVAKRADREKESLIRDIHNGTLSPSDPMDASLQQSLEPFCKADPKRARHLEQLAEQHGRLLPQHAWPDMDLLAVWTGGSVGMYLSQLGEYFGDTAIRDHGISASEGRMTVPLADGRPEGVLDYASHYYEFIPEHEHGSADPTVLEAHELTAGENYFILLTTEAGLYRYDIHDLVKCHGYEGQTPLLTFLNKGKNFASFTGEKLHEYQVVEAMRRTCNELQLEGSTFTLAPQYSDRLQYFLILGEKAHAQCGDGLAERFQQHLSEINHEYGDKTESGRILPIRLRVIPEAAWTKLREQKSSGRGNFEEYKHPCLTRDLDFLPRIEALVQSLEPASAC